MVSVVHRMIHLFALHFQVEICRFGCPDHCQSPSSYVAREQEVTSSINSYAVQQQQQQQPSAPKPQVQQYTPAAAPQSGYQSNNPGIKREITAEEFEKQLLGRLQQQKPQSIRAQGEVQVRKNVPGPVPVNNAVSASGHPDEHHQAVRVKTPGPPPVPHQHQHQQPPRHRRKKNPSSRGW